MPPRTAPKGLQEFLATPTGRGSPPWQIEQLAALTWPADAEPTTAVFERLRDALDATDPAPGDRSASR